MPMARKGKRQITYDGVVYWYAGEIDRGQVRLLVEHEGGGQRLMASFDTFVLRGEDRVYDDFVSKGFVGIAIYEGLKRGWQPQVRGRPHVLREAEIFGEHPVPPWTQQPGMGRQLLDAVFDAPEEEGPRLVLADWLTEQSDPRGLFIRQQCEGTEDRELRQRYWRQWSMPAWRVARRWVFQRGFIERLSLRKRPDRAAWESLHTIEPVRAVEATLAPRDAEILAWLPRPTHTELTLRGNIGAEGVCALCSSPWVRHLRRLVLSGNDETALTQIACSAHLDTLEELDLSEYTVGPAGALALRQSPHLAQTRVWLRGRRSLPRT